MSSSGSSSSMSGPQSYINPLAQTNTSSSDKEFQGSSLSSSSSSSSLNAPLLRSRTTRTSSFSSSQRQKWQWILVAAGLCLGIIVLLAITSNRILTLSLIELLGLQQTQTTSLRQESTSAYQLIAQLFPGIPGDRNLLATAAQCIIQGFLHVLQILQLVLANATTWLVEPLAICLLIDTVLLTLVGLLYQASTKLWRKPGQAAAYWASRQQLNSKVNLADATSVATGSAETDKAWPKVLVQLPMYNEREVYARAVASACQMAWPRSRMIIQVLDDSTEEDISVGMRQVVEEWRLKGVDVRYRHRVDRKGYKAGNLREGLTEGYAKDCKYVAVLDADFEPKADWLMQSIPYLEKDRSLALVQTRWTFSNEDECLVTQMQSIELTWHFWAEQLVSSLALRCFGFNGTAGVWRTDAILDSGNWRDDTTVEDMDMAVCAAMRGWKMLMVPEVECLSEVPSSYTAYRKQQHRWTSGPASLLRQRFWSIACTPGQALGWGQKVYLVGVYMVLRRNVRHLVGIALWALLSMWLLIPAVCSLVQSLSPTLHLSGSLGACTLSSPVVGFPFPWAALTFALLYPACLLCFSPRRLYLYPAYTLFMNGMLPSRMYAIMAGLFDLKSSRTWDVTQKLGKKKSQIGEVEGVGEVGRIEVAVEKTGADRVSGAKLLKRPEGSKAGGARLTSSSSSTNLSSGSCSPSSSSNGRKQQQPQFQHELLMGWALVLVSGACAAWWRLLNRQTGLEGNHRQGMEAFLWPAVLGSLFVQGCWNLWIGGSRWCLLPAC